METTPPAPPIVPSSLTARPVSKSRGFLPPATVRAFAFWTITLCILVSVVASVLAIWKFAEQDALWRTIATCVVVGFGALVFAVVNMSFGGQQDPR